MNCQPVAAFTMSTMSRNNSAPSLQGFSVYQPSVGAPLQFFPSVGSKELDVLIDAYLPGPASAKEKRSTISMDFCEHARKTGESFKFYQVYNAPVDSAGTSPASSAWDSAYGSSFDVSPILGDSVSWSFSSLPQSGPAKPAPHSKTRPAKKASSPPSRPSTDFSSLPGMKILTRDGRDVTNSASRGCKTKEQRDHAHLMRIIKACDSCKRKKVRCDPSHKKRSASQAQSQAEPKPAKKVKKAATAEPQQPLNPPATEPLSFEFDANLADLAFKGVPGSLEEPWDQFVQYDVNSDLNSALNVEGYDFWLDPECFLSPATNSSSASPTSQQPYTPSSARPSPHVAIDYQVLEAQQPDLPDLPFFNSRGNATDYVDFNLYSPESSFLDEEPLPLKSCRILPNSETDAGSRPLQQLDSNDESTKSPNAPAAFAPDSNRSLSASPGPSSFNEGLSTPQSEALGYSWSGLPAETLGDPNICDGVSLPVEHAEVFANRIFNLEPQPSATTTPTSESPHPARYLMSIVPEPDRSQVNGPERQPQGPGHSVHATVMSPIAPLSPRLASVTVAPPGSLVVSSYRDPGMATQAQQTVGANGQYGGAMSVLASNPSQRTLAPETTPSASLAATSQLVQTAGSNVLVLRHAAIRHSNGEYAASSHVVSVASTAPGTLCGDDVVRQDLEVAGTPYGSESTLSMLALVSVMCLGVVIRLVLAKLALSGLVCSGLDLFSFVVAASSSSVVFPQASPDGEVYSKIPGGIFSSFIRVAMSLAKAVWHRGSARLFKPAPRLRSVGASDNAKLSGRLAVVRRWISSLGWEISRLNGAKVICKGLE